MERKEWCGKRKRKEKKRDGLARKRQDANIGLTIWIYLQKCYCNSVSITQKYQNFVFIFTNSYLNLVRYEWWKQKMDTHPNKPCMCGTHRFWVMSDENRVMSNWKHKIQTPPSNRCQQLDERSYCSDDRCQWSSTIPTTNARDPIIETVILATLVPTI